MPSRSDSKPHDRRTQICDAALRALPKDVKRAIIFVEDEEGIGQGFMGYETDGDCIMGLSEHVKVSLRALEF